MTRLATAAAGLSLATAVAACGTGMPSRQVGTLPVPRGSFRDQIAVPIFSFQGQLASVTAVSVSDAWAVGSSGASPDAGTLMLHWDGRTWSRITSPAVLDGVPGMVEDVTAVSATDAWAVGFTGPTRSDSASADKPLILHWDGARWSVVVGLPPVTGGLTGITMSSHSGWVVGASEVAGHARPLILRWDRAGWHQVPPPASSAGTPFLSRVVVTSAGTAWAIGNAPMRGSPDLAHGVLLRWNGNSWQWASFPIAGPRNSLFDLAAGPDGTVWAVGQDETAAASVNNVRVASPPLSMRWTGVTWQAVPVPGAEAGFYGVTVAPGGAVWAVGGSLTGTVAMRWTGSAWAKVPVPTGDSPEANGGLASVAFSSPTDGWAVGNITETGAHAGTWPLIVHSDGTAWN